MLTIKGSVRSYVAGLVGAATLCIPIDMGADVSAIRAPKALLAETYPIVRSEPAQPLADEGDRPSVSRLDFTQRRPSRAIEPPVGTDVKGDAAQAKLPNRAPKQLGNVPTTLPASTAPRVFPSTMLKANKLKLSVATIRALQRELTRHGCYSGAIDGDWGPASHYAAATFIEAVNAKLPVDQPNEFLLALSRQYQGPACQQTSNIMTASTTQTWRATVKTSGSPAPGVERPSMANASPYSSRLTIPPRIMRANGAPRTVDLSNTLETPLPPPGEMDQRAQVALRTEPASPRPEPNTVTRYGTSHPKRNDAHRAAARSSQRQTRKRRALRKNWKRQVYQSINLSGS